MPKKVKFQPEITRIKLNPEQAVLACACFDVGRSLEVNSIRTLKEYCTLDPKAREFVSCRVRKSTNLS